jgi:tripartite-type tricarboxylate transporter receptor subunit TctC
LRILNAAIGEVLTSPEMVEQLAKQGAEPTFKTPEEFAAMIRADFEHWGPVVRVSGFLAD